MNDTVETANARRQNVEQGDHFIVVYDPEGEFWTGGVVDANRARQLEAEGIVLLPVAPKLFVSGVGGFHHRAWGAGYPLDFRVPRMVCPLTMYCVKELHAAHWAARLVVDESILPQVADGSIRLEGMLRFAADSGQAGTHQAAYSPETKPILLAELGAPDEDGGWTVRGHGNVTIPLEGHYGYALYGMAPGVRVVWAACTLA